jgi:proteic killer suppression protein
MIKSFPHKGLKRFFETGSKVGIQAAHAAKLSRQLSRLNQVKAPGDMNISGWKLHPLEHWLGVEQGGRAELWLEKQLAYDLWQARQTIQAA